MTTQDDIDAAFKWLVEDLSRDRTLDHILQPHTDAILSALEGYKTVDVEDIKLDCYVGDSQIDGHIECCLDYLVEKGIIK